MLKKSAAILFWIAVWKGIAMRGAGASGSSPRSFGPPFAASAGDGLLAYFCRFLLRIMAGYLAAVVAAVFWLC
ncbi:MAG: hypothetical protein ACLTQL_11500 [Eisenbergiella sp.]